MVTIYTHVHCEHASDTCVVQDMEQQRLHAMASDTRTITEAMVRKQLEAQNTRLAVSASSEYATNAKYIEVNSGLHPKVHVYEGMNIFHHVFDFFTCHHL